MSEHGGVDRRDQAGALKARSPEASLPAAGSRQKRALPLEVVSAGMVIREVSVRAPDVVFVKGLFEASDGLASVFAVRGGELTIVAPPGRSAELGELLADLEVELGARLGAGSEP